jgi:hypothetical protein
MGWFVYKQGGRTRAILEGIVRKKIVAIGFIGLAKCSWGINKNRCPKGS